MFSRSKNKVPKDNSKVDQNGKKERSKQMQFLIDVPKMPNTSFLDEEDYDNDEYDSDIEAELLALTQGTAAPTSRGKKEKRILNLDQMVDECMRDDDSGDNFSDEDDPELLAELSALATEEPEDPVVLVKETTNVVQRPAPVIIRPSPMVAGPSITGFLKERKQMYEEAEKNAVEAGETSRAKRFKRGLGTLNQMIKAAESGRIINEEDIPPAVALSSSRSASNLDLTEGAKSVPSSVSSPDFLSADVVMIPSAVQPDKSNDQTQKDTGEFHQPNVAPVIPIIVPHPITVVPPVIANINPPNPQGTTSSEIPSDRQLHASSSLEIVTKRQREYKLMALNSKKRGDIEEAMMLMKVVKQLQPLVEAAKEGKEIDVDSLPSHPSSSAIKEPSPQMVAPPPQQPFLAPPSDKPLTTMDALEQRMAFYEQQRHKAKADGNARKERMNQRIVKQFQEAIIQVKTGRLIDFSELPTPTGFPAIPVAGVTPTSSPHPRTQSVPRIAESTVSRIEPSAKESTEGPSPKQLKPNPVSAGSSSKVRVTPNVRNAPKSIVERQVSILQKRQQLFKEAALESKKKGEIEQAKEYLRNCKGFDQLIIASQSGFPVDMNTTPIPPQEVIASFSPVANFEVIGLEDCEIVPPKSAADMAVTYTKLEDELISQIKMCARTREHFKAVGDVASANRFEQLILHSKKDLDSVRAAFKRGDSPPKFHYETRSFTMIQCNTDLNDSDLEVVVVRGINYNVPNPKEVHTYVKVEFPYPTDSPPQDKTEVIKDTNCPEYNHKFLFSIDRKSRSLARIFKRHTIKFQVVNKGSWYHRDNVLGSVKVPLIHLENKCTHHDSHDLTDERKKMVGGKLEIKVRARNPILSKQLEKMSEKWLVIDGF